MLDTVAKAGRYLKPYKIENISCRPAFQSELPKIRQLVVNEITSNPHFNDDFKKFEIDRMSLSYLKHLHAVDPYFVYLCLDKNDIAGFIISGPECGLVWMYWGVALEEYRDGRIPVNTTRSLLEHFDNSCWEKICTSVRPSNKPALNVLKTSGFKPIVTLQNHWFGQDFVLMEKQFNRTKPGYETGVRLGRLGRLISNVRQFLDD